MSERVITISATTTNPKPLQITDWEGNVGTSDETDAAITTSVQPGDIVRWVFEGDITAITAITAKEGSSIVFSSGPSKDERDNSWAGVIGNNEPSGATESYTISYTVKDHPTEPPFIEDPKIEVKPTV